MSRRTPANPDKTLAADGNQWAILRDMLPYLWPAGHPGLKARVVFAMLALVLSLNEIQDKAFQKGEAPKPQP